MSKAVSAYLAPFSDKRDEITKRRLVYWLLGIMNSLASAVQLNLSFAIYYDRLFQLKQERLLPLVVRNTVQIQQIYKLLKISSKKRRPRRFWELPGRVGIWWDKIERYHEPVLPGEWVENFRMSKGSFFMSLCYELKP